MATWLDDVVGTLQGGYIPGAGASIFPDVRTYQTPKEQALAAELAAAGEAGGVPFSIAPNGYPRMPDVNSAGIQLALDNAPPGTGVPGPLGEGPVTPAERGMMALVGRGPGNIMAGPADGSIFGGVPDLSQFKMDTISPSIALAKAEAAPQSPQQPPAGPVPVPRPRPPGADAVTDMSSQSRGADVASGGLAGAPMSIAAPQVQPPPQAPAAAPEMSFGDRMRSFAPALLAASSALQGDNSVAASMMKQREAQALQVQQANATARLLQSRGAKPAEIQAAISGGPDAVKALLGEYLGKDKWKVVQTGEDSYGRKTFMQQNEMDGTLRPIRNKDGSASTDAVEGAAPQLNEAQQNRVKAIIDGREPYPAQSRAKDAQVIRDAVHAADPTFDAVNYNARLKARQSFTSGKDRDNLKSFNTTIGHLDELDKAVGDLHNSNFPAWNKYVANPVAEQFDPKYQSALKRFQAARTAVSDELTRAFRGSGGNVHDIVQWENAINAADSPEALRSAIRTAANLLESRISSVGDSYNAAMGTTKDPLELLTPHAREAFEQLKAGARNGAGASAPAAVKPGAYVWDPQRGLVPK